MHRALLHHNHPIEQSLLIFHFLKSLRASTYLVEVFKNVPERFVERFVRYVYIEELKKDGEWNRAFGTIDKAMFVAIFYDMERMAQNYNKVGKLISRLDHHDSFRSSLKILTIRMRSKNTRF